MDLIYGKRPVSGEESSESSKRTKLDTAALPIHLPGKVDQPETSLSEQPIDASNSNQGLPNNDEVSGPSGVTSGTGIVLETQADIDEWIRKRKENWMKKISNKRHADDEQGKPKVASTDSRLPSKVNQRGEKSNNPVNNARDQGRAKDNHNLGPRNRNNNTRQPKNNFNLNNAIIQRELSRENERVLDVIKELFDQGIVSRESR